jgi:hypothetical protein
MTKKNIQNTMNLTTFIKKYDLEYTWFYNNGVYTVYIKDLQILSENSCSTSEFGIGFTKKQALNEYANKIQNKKVVLHYSNQNKRLAILTPTFIVPKKSKYLNTDLKKYSMIIRTTNNNPYLEQIISDNGQYANYKEANKIIKGLLQKLKIIFNRENPTLKTDYHFKQWLNNLE